MLNLQQCLDAYRPLINVVTESDFEVLNFLQANYSKRYQLSVYSSTLASLCPLEKMLSDEPMPQGGSSQTLNEVLTYIWSNECRYHYACYVFLDADKYIQDKQSIRRIKDIILKYQTNTRFKASLIFVSQTVCVPPELDRLMEVVFFDLPSFDLLKEKSESLVPKLRIPEEKRPSDEIVNNLKGLTLFEVEQVYTQSIKLYKEIRLDFVRDFKKASLSKTNLLNLMETNVTFNDIGGLDVLKEWVIKSQGGWTLKGKEYGLPLLKGVLLVGLPGTGKSLIAKSVGNEYRLPVIEFDPSRIFSNRVGDSEANIRRVLKIIEDLSPCVLMIDEIEKAFAGMQSSTFSDGGVTSRVIRSFLIWMQDCTKPVFTVATANNLQYLPPEMISRFDEVFFVNLPQEKERKDIFKIHIKKINRDPEKIDTDKLAKASQDLSGREIEQVLREAMYDSFSSGKELSTGCILKVLSKKTNLLTTMSEQLAYILKWVGWDENKQDGVRARFANIPDTGEKERIQNEIEKMLKDVEKDGNSKGKQI
jgi:AAA+ superfamily predicted ATPase